MLNVVVSRNAGEVTRLSSNEKERITKNYITHLDDPYSTTQLKVVKSVVGPKKNMAVESPLNDDLMLHFELRGSGSKKDRE